MQPALRRRRPGPGANELLDPVVERPHLLVGRIEWNHAWRPSKISMRVGEGAGAETAADGQVHAVAQAPAAPPGVVELTRHAA